MKVLKIIASFTAVLAALPLVFVAFVSIVGRFLAFLNGQGAPSINDLGLPQILVKIASDSAVIWLAAFALVLVASLIFVTGLADRVRALYVHLVPCKSHDWYWCVCRRCGQKQVHEHEWSKCICQLCLAKREHEHRWQPSSVREYYPPSPSGDYSTSSDWAHLDFSASRYFQEFRTCAECDLVEVTRSWEEEQTSVYELSS